MKVTPRAVRTAICASFLAAFANMTFASYDSAGNGVVAPDYQQTPGAVTTYTYDSGANSVELMDFNMTPVNPTSYTYDSVGNTPVTSFFDVFTEVSLDGGQTWTAYDLQGNGTLQYGAGTPDQTTPYTYDYQTQMTALDLSGSATDGSGHTLRIEYDADGSPPPGDSTDTTLNGGGFRINSFFDIFTEISLDNGPLIPADGGPSQGSIVVDSIPEPDSDAMLLAGLATLAAVARRRKAS